MLTIEKFLKFVSASTLAATVIFTVTVVIQELVKPKEVIERIKKEKCLSFSETGTFPESESDLEKTGSDCVLVPESMREKSDFAASLFRFRRLDGFDYLFSGKAGVLLKKHDDSLPDEAGFIVKCFRNGECSEKIPDKKRTISAVALDSNGNAAISVTYEDNPVVSTALNLKKLFGEIAKIKKLDLDKLRLVLYFHSEYAYLEDKSDIYLISMPENGVDGLYLKSRGAKIRLLPWEYSTNPLSVLDRKGVQYGLEKDEYKKEAASVYLYRTTQFAENNGSAVPWRDGSSLKKTTYSPLFSLRLIMKHLKNIQKNDGSFPAELQTSDAKEKPVKESLLMQATAAEIFLKSKEFVEDSTLSALAEKTLEYVSAKDDADTAAQAKVAAVSLENGLKFDKKQSKFRDFEFVKDAVSSNFIYSGLFIEAFALVSEDKDKDEKITELLNTAFSLFETANDENKLRFIAYLADFDPEKGSEPDKKTKNFFVSQSRFIKERVFDSRGFPHKNGSFAAEKNKKTPDTSLSLLLSDGLLKALSNGRTDSETAETALSSSAFINKLVVSGDDFPNWGDTKAKIMIQGGVRASDRAKSVKLSNTLRAASYFINRIKREKE